MLVHVKVFPKSGREEVLQVADGLKVYVKAAPEGGKANVTVARLLAEHFHVTSSAVRLVSGATSRKKMFEIAL